MNERICLIFPCWLGCNSFVLMESNHIDLFPLLSVRDVAYRHCATHPGPTFQNFTGLVEPEE